MFFFLYFFYYTTKLYCMLCVFALLQCMVAQHNNCITPPTLHPASHALFPVARVIMRLHLWYLLRQSLWYLWMKPSQLQYRPVAQAF